MDASHQVAELRTQLAAKDAEIAELRKQVRQLTALVEVLKEQLSRNSKNSHLPPSSDGPGANSKGGSSEDEGPRDENEDGDSSSESSETKRLRSGRKPGGQKGHRGAHRELAPPDAVDEVIDLFPEVCLGCGADDLRQIPDPEPLCYQELDLRDHRPHIKEARRHEVECGRCGCRTRAAYDPAKIPRYAFGPRLTSVVALLTGEYHLSRRKAQQLLVELFGISVSLGSISNMEQRASEALESAYEEAKREIDAALVKYADATSWARGALLMSLWTITTASATVFGIFVNGCRETILPFFGSRTGILVSDRASVFAFWSMAFRQICWAHLIRKFIAFSQRDGPAGAVGRELLGYTAVVFDYWHGYKDGVLTRDELEAWLRPVRRQFEDALARAAAADIPRLSGSCLDILAHREALWTFATHEGVEPTNNHAERALRAFVLWRKRCFGSKSERGERFAERLMTVAHTARKQGKAVLDFIVKSVAARLTNTAAPQLIDAPTPA